MKRIATVKIIASDLFESWIEVYRNTGEPGLQRRSYPLTPRNYWRAAGMQLRLAGFVDRVHSFEFDKEVRDENL